MAISIAANAASRPLFPSPGAERAIACVERLATLGDYRFRRSRVETHRWWDHRWLDAPTMITMLRAPSDGRSGDVYAVRHRGSVTED